MKEKLFLSTIYALHIVEILQFIMIVSYCHCMLLLLEHSFLCVFLQFSLFRFCSISDIKLWKMCRFVLWCYNLISFMQTFQCKAHCLKLLSKLVFDMASIRAYVFIFIFCFCSKQQQKNVIYDSKKNGTVKCKASKMKQQPEIEWNKSSKRTKILYKITKFSWHFYFFLFIMSMRVCAWN